jgi:L-fuculose-phosphate aldolase
VLAVHIERAAKLQLLAMSAGEIRRIDPDLAREAHDYRLKERAIGATFTYYARRALKTDPEAGLFDAAPARQAAE